jgi:hypothetical protein
MLDTSFLGVVDLFEQSAAAGRWFLDPVFPNVNCAQPPVNVSGGMEGTVAARRRKLREACGRSVYRELLRLNTFDIKLLRRARAEVRRRLASMPRPVVCPDVQSTVGGASAGPQDNWVSYFRLRRSGLFDSRFYLTRYPDVKQAGINALRHYLRYGAAEGRKPNPLFEPEFYWKRRPETHRSGNPLLDFMDKGSLCSPHPLFDCAAYVQEHPDTALQPLAHYLKLRPARKHVRLPDGSQAVRVRILDVPLSVALLEDPPNVPSSETPQVWKSPCGRTEFQAPPEQRALFRIVKFEQWLAQVTQPATGNVIPER